MIHIQPYILACFDHRKLCSIHRDIWREHYLERVIVNMILYRYLKWRAFDKLISIFERNFLSIDWFRMWYTSTFEWWKHVINSAEYLYRPMVAVNRVECGTVVRFNDENVKLTHLSICTALWCQWVISDVILLSFWITKSSNKLVAILEQNYYKNNSFRM